MTRGHDTGLTGTDTGGRAPAAAARRHESAATGPGAAGTFANQIAMCVDLSAVAARFAIESRANP